MNHKDIQKTAAIAAIFAMIMFSFSFVLAPLYNVLCKTTGLNGRLDLTKVAPLKSDQAPDLHRNVTMQFVTTTNAALPWDFYPKNTSVTIHPEMNTKVFFVVKNNSKQTMTVQAIPSITPWQAATHLHKIECFCFKQQTLKAGESLEMPVVFRLDNALPQEIQTVTLAYTLFAV
jgi:cytochrome c oxidase assembly protein subunit 11